MPDHRPRRPDARPSAATRLLDPYHRRRGSEVVISTAQGSRFAKEVAGDYNPLHDEDASRFCVPGDLLFALVLRYYGLPQALRMVFSGMLRGGVPLHFPNTDAARIPIAEPDGRVYAEVERSGRTAAGAAEVEALTRAYVAFSARSFPELLQPLLARHGVMFNPERPLVVYDFMELDLAHTPGTAPELELVDSVLEPDGKRAKVRYHFRIREGERELGTGVKALVVSGLRPYDEARMQRFIEDFARRY